MVVDEEQAWPEQAHSYLEHRPHPMQLGSSTYWMSCVSGIAAGVNGGGGGGGDGLGRWVVDGEWWLVGKEGAVGLDAKCQCPVQRPHPPR